MAITIRLMKKKRIFQQVSHIISNKYIQVQMKNEPSGLKESLQHTKEC